MKARKIVLSLFLALSVLSCKNEEKKPNEVVAEPAKSVKVTISAIVKTDDDFQLFFSEANDTTTPFEETNSVWTKVTGSDAVQNIEFVLPADVLPSYLRLDIGKNEAQKGVTIGGMKIEYLGKKFDISTANFFNNYFVHNNSVEVKDKATGEIITKKDGNGTYDPVFNSGDNLKPELEKLYL